MISYRLALLTKPGKISQQSATTVGLSKNIFLSVIRSTQLYFLSVLSEICLSYIFKSNNKAKYQAGPGLTIKILSRSFTKLACQDLWDLRFRQSLTTWQIFTMCRIDGFVL